MKEESWLNKEIYVMGLLGQHINQNFSNFVAPDWDDEYGEIERTVNSLYKNLSQKEEKQKSQLILKAFKKVKPQILSNKIWEKLENSDSPKLKTGDKKTAIALSKKYGRTIEWIFDAIKNNKEIPMPQILFTQNRYILVGGNTRLMAFKVLGINPKVVLLKY